MQKIHDLANSDKDSGTYKELKEMEIVGFEEKIIDKQLIDNKDEPKSLSKRNDQKMLDKERKAQEEKAEEQKARNTKFLESKERMKRKRRPSQNLQNRDKTVKSAKLPP